MYDSSLRKLHPMCRRKKFTRHFQGPQEASRYEKIAFFNVFPLKKSLPISFRSAFCTTLSYASFMPCAKEKSSPVIFMVLKKLQGMQKSSFLTFSLTKRACPFFFETGLFQGSSLRMFHAMCQRKNSAKHFDGS